MKRRPKVKDILRKCFAKQKEQKGITLIALVITIVILIILATVSMNALWGEDGLIKYASDAKKYQSNAEISEGGWLQNTSEYIDSIINGNDINNGNENDDETEEKLPKKILWFGDSLMRGYGNNNKGFPEYFEELTGIECINSSFSGSTITDNTAEATGSSDPITLKSQVESILSRPDIVNPSDVELIVLDGGGNDILLYNISGVNEKYKKEVGTADDTTSDTVINDFREVIDMLKQKFINAKIIFTEPLPFDETFVELIVFNSFAGDATLDELNKEYNQHCATIEEFRNLYFQIRTDISSICDSLTSRSEQLFSELEVVCGQLGVEYLDLSYIADENRAEDGSDTNTYLQADRMHITDEGYRAITPYIVEKVKSLF